MIINLKNLSLRADLILSVTTAKRFCKWRYNYKKSRKTKLKEKENIKLNRRVKKHLKKSYFRKLIFKL